MKLSQHMMLGNAPLVQISGTTSATAGNRFTVAHGLRDHVGKTAIPAIVIPVARAADADGALTAADIQVVGVDATNITLRSTVAGADFDLFIG